MFIPYAFLYFIWYKTIASKREGEAEDVQEPTTVPVTSYNSALFMRMVLQEEQYGRFHKSAWAQHMTHETSNYHA